MLTPLFNLTQDDQSIFIEIHAKYVKVCHLFSL